MPRRKKIEKLIDDISSLNLVEELHLVLGAAQDRLQELDLNNKFIDDFYEQIDNSGKSLNDVIALLRQKAGGGKVSSRGKVAPKYRYIDENGEEFTWTGRGRKPEVFANLVAQGHDIEEFAIKED